MQILETTRGELLTVVSGYYTFSSILKLPRCTKTGSDKKDGLCSFKSLCLRGDKLFEEAREMIFQVVSHAVPKHFSIAGFNDVDESFMRNVFSFTGRFFQNAT